MKYLLLPLCMLSFLCCDSQLIRSSIPVSYTTVGTYSKHFSDVFSFTKNQASLSGVKSINAGIYSERRFMLQDLKAFSAVASFPSVQGGVGIAADYTGFTSYNQSHIGLAYGRSLGSKIDLGIQFNYNRMGIAGYGNASALNFEIGTILHLTEKMYAGCHVYNPVGGKFGKNDGEKLSSVYSFGIGYDVSDKLYIGSDIIKEENQRADVNIALHYAFEKRFFIRGGINTSLGNYFAGAGVLWRNIRLDIVADRHPQAGLTPSLLLIFVRPNPKSEAE